MTPVGIELKLPEGSLENNELLSLGSLRLQCHSCPSKDKLKLPKELGRSRYLDRIERLFKRGEEHDRTKHKGKGDIVLQVGVVKRG